MNWRMLLPLALIAWVAPLRADQVQLTNGDVINGKVLSLNSRELELDSDVHGTIKIQRSRVDAILLGDRKPLPAAPSAEAKKSSEEIIAQLRRQGVDAATLKDIQTAAPLLGNPKAKKYFDDTVAGLISGKLDVQDLRQDAIKTRDQLRELKRDLKGDLGGQADVLDMYLGILENFVDETAPAGADDAKEEADGTTREQD